MINDLISAMTSIINRNSNIEKNVKENQMKTRKRILCVIGLVVLCFWSLTSVFAAAPAAASKDVLLDLLPADCTLCVRVNNLQQSLAQLDQYLAGASPMPMELSKMASTQLVGIFGDPQLNGINMQGDFAAASLMTGQEKKDFTVFFLIPSSGIKDFLKKNTNLSPVDTDGVYTLKAPNSPAGELAVIPLSEPNYLLVGQQKNKADLLTVRKMMKEKTTSLKSRLTPDIAKAAVKNPAWAYFNIDKLYQLYTPEIKNGFDEMQKAITEQSAQGNDAFGMEMMGKVFDMYKYFAEQADGATLCLNPQPQQMQIETTLSAKAGSELAGMLKPSLAAGKNWQYAGAVDNAAAVKMLMRFNKPLWEKLNGRLMDIFCTNTTQADKATIDKMKALTPKMLAAMGDEAAVSFSYRSGTPPFEFQEIVAVNDAKAVIELQKEAIPQVESMYQTMGMPITFTYAPSVEKYHGIDIGLYQFKFTVKDPNDKSMKAVEMMYGKEGLQYPMAITADKFLVAMGPDAMTQLKALIDAKQPGPAVGDMKAALALIADNTKSEMVASINLLKLMKGVSQMGQQMIAQSGQEMPDFWKGIEINTTSCMAAATFVENGSVRCRIVLPKEHLKETTAVMMQVQQQQMKYYQQKQAQAGADANMVSRP